MEREIKEELMELRNAINGLIRDYNDLQIDIHEAEMGNYRLKGDDYIRYYAIEDFLFEFRFGQNKNK